MRASIVVPGMAIAWTTISCFTLGRPWRSVPLGIGSIAPLLRFLRKRSRCSGRTIAR